MKRERIITKLVNTYPDDIVFDGGMVLIEETVGNFAARLMEDMDGPHQKSTFGQIFETEEDMYYYMLNDLTGLAEACQDYVWNHWDKYKDMGD